MRKFLCTLSLSIFTCIMMAGAQSNPASHTVVKGETLYSISKQYHVSVAAIEAVNNMKPGELKIKIGQKIKIPAASSASADKKTESKPAAPDKNKKPEPAVAKSQSESSEKSSSSALSTHIVVKGETVYSLSRLYGVKVQQLKAANHLPDDMKLKLGQKLIIPAANPEASYKPAPPAPKETQEPKVLKEEKVEVVKKETPKPSGDENPFVVPTAKKEQEPGRDYIKSEPEPVKKETPKQEKVEPVKTADTKPVPKQDVTKEPAVEMQKESKDERKTPGQGQIVPDVMRPSEYPAMFGRYEGSGKKKSIYRGIGAFMQNENPGNQYLALYNYAEMGSILKVTNLMSKQYIYVKVVGKVPAADAQNEVILKLSNEAATQLKVTEDKFLVEVTGYNP